MIYVKHVSLIQSGGVIRDEEATATPETEGADLSDADKSNLCSNNERLDRNDQTAHTKRFFLCTKRKEIEWKEDYLHQNL